LFSFEKFKAERRGFYVIYAPLGKLFIDISYRLMFYIKIYIKIAYQLGL